MTLARFTLLGTFAAVGVALALCVGLSTELPPDDTAESQAVGQITDETDSAGSEIVSRAQPTARGSETEPSSLPDDVAASGPPDEAGIATAFSEPPPVPAGPTVAVPYPAHTFQIANAEADGRLLKVIEYLADRLGQEPAAQPEPQPAAGDTSPQAASQAGPEITSDAEGEGDGQLSMQFLDSDIREVLDALAAAGNLNILASNSVQGTVSATLNNVDIGSALEAILKSTGFAARREGNFIYVGTSEDFDDLEHSLDTVGTRIYRPNYVTASELQTLVQALLTDGVGVVSVSTPAEQGIASDATNAGADNFAGGDVVLVRDYEAVLAEIDQVVREIDVRPMQVAIEAMILSVRLSDGMDFGVDFELLRNQENLRLGWEGPLQALTSFPFTGGLKFAFLDDDLGAFLNALETIGDTNVIATPRLMVLNKQRAEILIGEELGYVSTTMTETSSSQSVEFLEVGTQLRLRPFISTDGLIRMEIHPELSSGSVVVEDGFTLPNKETTQVTTNIMVRDGCTMVIGGLIREELSTTTTQVPLFGSLPLIGVAFRNKSEEIERREILVLITPHIVYEPETSEEGDVAACEFHRRQATYAEKMSPLTKPHIARRYFRRAQEAWAVGNRRAAMRYAEMAVHFNPLDRAAIDLRSDIWLGEPEGQHTLGGPPIVMPAPDALDGQTIAPWLLEDLGRAATPLAPPMHPLDPGIPGRHQDIERPRRLQ